MLFFVLAATKDSAGKKTPTTLDSYSNSNLFALVFLFRLLFAFNLFVSPLSGFEITQVFLVQQVKG